AIAGLADDGRTAIASARYTVADVRDLPPAELADARLARSLADDLMPAMVSLARSAASSTMADDTLVIEESASIDYRCSLPGVRRLASSFGSAAGSNLEYLDALAQGAQFADPDYTLARFAGSVRE